MRPPYCLKLATFAGGILCAVLALGLLLAGNTDAASILFGLALTAGFFIPTAARAVERREHADRLAWYVRRRVSPPSHVGSLVVRTGATVAVLALVMVWAQQTPNGDAAVARQACAGPLPAGSESC